MHLKIHRGFHNAVLGYCMEFRNREVLLLCNASNHIAEQMMAIDTTDADTDGEQELFVLIEIHSYNGIALLGCLTYSGEAVALVERNLSLCILETDDFVSRQRMAAGTTLILHLWTVGEETAQTTLCLIGKHMVLPVCFWYSILCSTYLYTIATMEHCLYRG